MKNRKGSIKKYTIYTHLCFGKPGAARFVFQTWTGAIKTYLMKLSLIILFQTPLNFTNYQKYYLTIATCTSTDIQRVLNCSACIKMYR